MNWYFAYGSNMDPARLFSARMAAAGVAWGARIAARLEGWRLAFNKPWSLQAGAGVANIMQSPGDVVHGTLNELGEGGLEALDRYEGVAAGHYSRRIVTVLRSDDVPVQAVTYVAGFALDDALKPTAAYLAHLLAGRDLLPPDYGARLAATETQG